MTDQRNLQNGIAATRLGEGNENTHYSQQMSGSISPLPYLSLPPTDQVQDLALDLFRTYKGNFPLNAYEIYRYLYIKYINSRGVQTTEPELTTFIQNAWSKESNKVREFYQTVESIYSKMLGTSHISVMSPNSSGLLSNSINLIQDDTGPDFCLFHANNLQSFGPPTPRSINASPSFDTSNIYGSRNDVMRRIMRWILEMDGSCDL
ncbi:13350_t:CDS:2, partial [Gigaspora margarita]